MTPVARVYGVSFPNLANIAEFMPTRQSRIFPILKSRVKRDWFLLSFSRRKFRSYDRTHLLSQRRHSQEVSEASSGGFRLCESRSASAVLRVGCRAARVAPHPTPTSAHHQQSSPTVEVPQSFINSSAIGILSSSIRHTRLDCSVKNTRLILQRRYFTSTVAAMGAIKLDGNAIAKSIRERLGQEILEKQKLNPRFKPSLKIIQGSCYMLQSFLMRS